jgi:hypothetical protein
VAVAELHLEAVAHRQVVQGAQLFQVGHKLLHLALSVQAAQQFQAVVEVLLVHLMRLVDLLALLPLQVQLADQPL